jgi:DNA polymerase III gamma/tau subunit
LASLNLLQNNSRISSSPSFIKQIKQESKDFFYDFTVPIYNNYWTKGFIHHNCGKTTIARIIAKMSECSDSDTYEYNSANARGIDTIREISMNMYYAGMFNRNKAYIFDEAHAITSAAKEATLKMLEDTPSHVTFILCTTEPELLPKTIHTRSSSYKVTPLTNEEMRSLIQWVLNSEGTKNFSKNIIEEIIKVADGCPREALVILDQVIDIKEERKALAAINTFVIGEAEVIEICQGIMKGRPWSEMKKKVAIVLKTTESEKLRYAILNYFSTVLLDERGFTKPSDFDRVSSLIDLFSDNTFYSKKAGVINMIYLACK